MSPQLLSIQLKRREILTPKLTKLSQLKISERNTHKNDKFGTSDPSYSDLSS